MPLSGEDLADLVEAYLLGSGARAGGNDELRRNLGSIPADITNFDFALGQMAWRERVLGDAYPFRLEAGGVRVAERHAPNLSYIALLLATPISGIPVQGRDYEKSSRVVETISCAALRALLGPGARAVRFAWPSDEGRPREFPDAIRWLAEQMQIRLGTAYRPPRRKDGGVDVIAWRPFPDGRPGFPIVLAQCTIEADFVAKARDIEVRIWSTWLGFDVDPMCVLTIPRVVGRNEDWNEVGATCVLLERLRLCSLVRGADEPADADVAAFVEERVAAARVWLESR